MIEDSFEHICNGCFTIIAPCDPHAYRKGAQFFHRLSCEEQMHERSYAHYLGARYSELEPGVEEKGWIAVPARLLRWGQARPAARQGWSSDSYAWLAGHEPVTVIGNSIFVYEIW